MFDRLWRTFLLSRGVVFLLPHSAAETRGLEIGEIFLLVNFSAPLLPGTFGRDTDSCLRNSKCCAWYHTTKGCPGAVRMHLVVEIVPEFFIVAATER